MNEVEIRQACKDVASDATRRGINHGGCTAFIRSNPVFEDSAAWVNLTVYRGKDIEGEGPDFTSAFKQIRARLADHIPDEDRLAAVLGYREIQLPQAAE